MNQNEYQLRRKMLMEQMGSASIAVISSAKACLRNGNNFYPYRQDSNFYYLTGFDEQDAVAVLIPGRPEGEFVLFLTESNPDDEIWLGARTGLAGACRDFGVDQAFPIGLIDSLFPKLLINKSKLYFDIGRNNEFDTQVMRWVDAVKSKVLDGIKAPQEYVALSRIVSEMRVYKSPAEIALIRKAAEITSKAHLRAMQTCRPGMLEYQLEAEVLYEFMRNGGRYESFKTMVGGGRNACTLHYTKNEEELVDGELVLVDAGVEYEYYSGDISRTFPVSGKFSQEQRLVYQAVLNVQETVLNEIRPGVSWDHLQKTSERAICEQLVAIGLLQGEIERLIEQKAFLPFYMHKIGHFLGLDVHDAGDYRINSSGKWRELAPGMIFTVEPGIYITQRISGIDSKWYNIGVRIEDNVLITTDGYEILTSSVPKSIVEIEAVMAKNKIPL